jgi:HNH endonuclease
MDSVFCHEECLNHALSKSKRPSNKEIVRKQPCACRDALDSAAGAMQTLGMRRTAPTAARQLEFLKNVEQILSRGLFNTTYKFALLISLANIAVERGSDSGDELEVDLRDLAQHVLDVYWGMARPYPQLGAVLRQSTSASRPARIVTMLEPRVGTSQRTFRRFRAYQADRHVLISQTVTRLKRDVLHRLHTLGRQRDSSESNRFLYDRPSTQSDCARLTKLTLRPGVAGCLRSLRGVVIAMVQAKWASWIREHNASLGKDRHLEDFLFGARARTNIRVFAKRLYEIQDGRCFYTCKRLGSHQRGDVDHFIPWARYPFDSPFNLVLASPTINNRFRDELKPVEWRAEWLQRNETYFGRLTAPEPGGFGAAADDAQTAKAISDWIYRTPA